MSNKSIWVLQGSTGEYSDRYDWIVRAYQSKEQADKDCTKANDEAFAWKAACDANPILDWPMTEEDKIYADKEKELYLTIDPNMSFSYTGTSYWVVECELA